MQARWLFFVGVPLFVIGFFVVVLVNLFGDGHDRQATAWSLIGSIPLALGLILLLIGGIKGILNITTQKEVASPVTNSPVYQAQTPRSVCPNCGLPIGSGGAFCSGCGTQLI